MSFWVVGVQDLTGSKGFFDSISKIARWAHRAYHKRRKETVKTQTEIVDGKEVSFKAYTLPILSLSEILRTQVYIIDIRKSKLEVHKFLGSNL